MSNQEFVAEQYEVEAEEVQEQAFNQGIFTRAIRFKGGEEIVCGVHADDFDWTVKKFIVIHQPMVLDAATKKMKPWSDISDDFSMEISTDLVRTMYEVKHRYSVQWSDAAAEQYFAHLRERLEDDSISDEERTDIEQELLMASDGSEEEESVLEVPGLFNHVPVSKTLH
jgi:hypothetical protein